MLGPILADSEIRLTIFLSALWRADLYGSTERPDHVRHSPPSSSSGGVSGDAAPSEAEAPAAGDPAARAEEDGSAPQTWSGRALRP